MRADVEGVKFESDGIDEVVCVVDYEGSRIGIGAGGGDGIETGHGMVLQGGIIGA